MALHTLAIAPAEPLSLHRWPTVPGVRLSAAEAKSRRSFYGATLVDAAALSVDWSPRHRFVRAAARACLQCVEGPVEIWVAHGPWHPDARLSLDQLPADLPEALRRAVVEEVLGDVLRRWALAHGLCVLALDIQALASDIPEKQRNGLAFCGVEHPQHPTRLRLAAISTAPEVHARLRNGNPGGAALQGFSTRCALRTLPVSLGGADAQAMRQGDGLELGELPAQGLALDMVSASGQHRFARLHWKGNRVTFKHLDGPDPSLQTTDEELPAAPAAPPAAVTVVAMDRISLRLSVEVASLDVPVGEMARWRSGHVLDLDLPLDNTRVALLINERVVGRGQMVVLEDRLAVEVTEWSLGNHGAHAV